MHFLQQQSGNIKDVVEILLLRFTAAGIKFVALLPPSVPFHYCILQYFSGVESQHSQL